MILNFLTNACKYTDRGEIKVKFSRKPGSAAEPEMLLVEVADTGTPQCAPFLHFPVTRLLTLYAGVGVDDAKIGSIFEAFAQVQSGQVTGTGLGLYGVRTRVEGLNGTCGARHNTESSTGTGTVLWFAIPYIPDRSDDNNGDAPRIVCSVDHSPLAQSAEIGHAPIRGPISPKAPSIEEMECEDSILALIRKRQICAMVIDDTSTVRKLMERLLMKMGFASVVCYENGAKGLDAMMAAPVDIVFSDIQMPIMTGPEVSNATLCYIYPFLSTCWSCTLSHRWCAASASSKQRQWRLVRARCGNWWWR